MTQTQLKNKYQVNVSTLAAGTQLIGYPCIVYEITVTSDAAGDVSVSFADKLTPYTNNTRLVKIKTSDEQQTKQVVFPKGKKFSTGMTATANKASVDVSITFE